MPSPLEEKRAAAIKAREDARKKSMDETKARKVEAQKARETSACAEASRKEREKEDLAKKDELQKKREDNIRKREEDRQKQQREQDKVDSSKGKAKYAKSEIVMLKEIFDSYDRDRSGSISQSELRDALVKQRDAQQRNDKAKNKPPNKGGVDLLQLIDPIFHQMDTNSDGTVEFPELLKVLYPRATDQEMQVMLCWVKEAPAPVVEKGPEFTQEQLDEMKAIFNLYDTDGSGTITQKELVAALESTGMNRKEITELFEGSDADKSDSLTFEEFTKMMSTADLY